jgi:hypothetical protein
MLVYDTEDRWHLRNVARFLDFREAVCENADDVIRVEPAAFLLSYHSYDALSIGFSAPRRDTSFLP